MGYADKQPHPAADIPIDKGVPIPVRQRRHWGQKFASLEVGDSFLLKTCLQVNTVATSATYYSKRLGHQYTVRRVEDGWRCWRIK